MKAISINAYEIENDNGETMVFMTPKEFNFIKKQNELKDKEIEGLNNIIDKQDRDITSLTKSKIKLKERVERAIEYCKELMEFKKNSRQYLIGKCMLEILCGVDK